MDDGMLPVFEEATPVSSKKARKKPGTAQVVLIQSVCCAVLVLLFWLFKVLGGGAYDQLRGAFQNALKNNAILETVSGIFKETKPDESYVQQDGTTVTTAASNTTAASTAATGSTTAATTVTTAATKTAAQTTHG